MKITLPPSFEGYAVRRTAEFVHIALEGGLGRTRRDVIDTTRRVNVKWRVSKAGHEYLNKVHRYYISHNAEEFTIDLIVDTAAPVEHVGRFVPGTFGLESFDGIRYVWHAQMDVLPVTYTTWPGDLDDLPGGTLPWLYYPTEPWPEGSPDESLAPIHKRTYEFAPITGDPEPFVYNVGVVDNLVPGDNTYSVADVVIPLFGDSGIPLEGQYTWENADAESTITPVFSEADPSGGVWVGPNLFVSLSEGGGALSGWGGGVLTLYAGNNIATGAGAITIITFLPSSFVYPPVSVYYGPLS